MADWYWDAATTQQQALYADRDGTLAKPWVLDTERFGINAGAIDYTQIQPGDTLWVRDTHVWASFDTRFIAESLTDVTIRGDYPGRPGWVTLINLDQFTNCTIKNLTVATVTLGRGDILLIENCDIRGGSIGLRMSGPTPGNCDNVTLRECRIFDHSHNGVVPYVAGYFSDGWLIEDCHIYDVGVDVSFPTADCEGIGLQRHTNLIIRNNLIENCDYGINIFENGGASSNNILIQGNTIRNIATGPSDWPSRGIMFSGSTTTLGSLYDITIEDNLVYGIDKEGIRLQAPSGADGLVCRNNVIADVNRVYGTPNTEFITGPAEWALSGNRTYPIFRTYNRSNNSLTTRSWKL